ncbi:MAG: hypothetical protein LUH03_00020 [Oscillospiraceae bacterium]|nr:hypothetical protein [Clostridiales bacterium]MCD7803528.1 hypothetical protein [Oscillospiraceae bacterium]
MTQEQIEAISEDPKTFLLQGRNAQARIAAKRERIDSWRQLAESITVTLKADGGSSPGGYKQSLVENAACNIIDLENEIIADINELAGIEMVIHEAINLFVKDDRYRAVLEMKYLNGYGWRRIASKLYYGEDWVCRLHGAALQEMKRNAEISLLDGNKSC